MMMALSSDLRVLSRDLDISVQRKAYSVLLQHRMALSSFCSSFRFNIGGNCHVLASQSSISSLASLYQERHQVR